MSDQWNHKIFNVDKAGFESLALEIFRFQYAHNPVYAGFVNTIGSDPRDIQKLNQIPFLPIDFFKTHSVQTTSFEPALIFESSGTTGAVNSKHLIKEIHIYEESFLHTFESFYGDIKQWCILGLLPSYLERSHSSLVYMVDRLIHLSKNGDSGFFLHDHQKLFEVLNRLKRNNQRTLLIGVTYALLDFAEKYNMPLARTVIMETGGMKGRREELIREEVHERIKSSFGTGCVHSEYGMTELLSQSYSVCDGIFKSPAWMKILIRDEEDPFELKQSGAGILNIIDLANVYSCSFIATDDAGRLYEDGSFEVLGRIDNRDIRGCSLLINSI